MQELPTSLLHAQYNPDRFKFWQQVCTNVSLKDYLNMKYSPHVALLKQFEENGGRLPERIQKTPYYQMHKKYGKSDGWTREKIDKFIDLYKDIKKNGISNPPIILNAPIVINEFNMTYEIFEGHHRCSVATFLEIHKIKCKLKKI